MSATFILYIHQMPTSRSTADLGLAQLRARGCGVGGLMVTYCFGAALAQLPDGSCVISLLRSYA